jgi:hypothetical protein
MVPPPARQQFKDHVFAQFIRFVMLHDAQVGVHAADKFYTIFAGGFVVSGDFILISDSIIKIAFGTIGNIDAVGHDYGAKELNAF